MKTGKLQPQLLMFTRNSIYNTIQVSQNQPELFYFYFIFSHCNSSLQQKIEIALRAREKIAARIHLRNELLFCIWVRKDISKSHEFVF